MAKKVHVVIHTDGLAVTSEGDPLPPGLLQMTEQNRELLELVGVRIGKLTSGEVMDREHYPQLETLERFPLSRVISIAATSKRNPPRHVALFVEIDAESTPELMAEVDAALTFPGLEAAVAVHEARYGKGVCTCGQKH